MIRNLKDLRKQLLATWTPPEEFNLDDLHLQFQNGEWGALRPGSVADETLEGMQKESERWHGFAEKLKEEHAQDDPNVPYPPYIPTPLRTLPYLQWHDGGDNNHRGKVPLQALMSNRWRMVNHRGVTFFFLRGNLIPFVSTF